MPSQEAIAQTVNRYLELVASGTADDIVKLYTADATLEDPVGTDLRRGAEAVHEFYKAVEGVEKETELVHIRVSGSEAAFFWHLTLVAGDGRTRISPISVMEFDEDARITSMRAFWSPSDIQVL